MMHYVDRRTLLSVIAVTVLAACGAPVRSKTPMGRVPAPHGVLTRLPGDGNQVALTVDDGLSVDVVAAYAQFCRDSGTRLTFFVNGVNPAWSVNAPALRRMVESGHIALGSHTWSHADLTRLNPGAVADEIRQNAAFLRNMYGVDGTPFFRPPYGRHTAITDKVCADLGYPTITMASGDIYDWRPEDETTLIAHAKAAFQPQRIVVGHANLPTVTRCYAQLLDIIQSRNLQTVTLNEIFG
jgi:peptidoglycan-N-acetylglucosamine deacetylase